jgi:hypothetical protein
VLCADFIDVDEAVGAEIVKASSIVGAVKAGQQKQRAAAQHHQLEVRHVNACKVRPQRGVFHRGHVEAVVQPAELGYGLLPSCSTTVFGLTPPRLAPGKETQGFFVQFAVSVCSEFLDRLCLPLVQPDKGSGGLPGIGKQNGVRRIPGNPTRIANNGRTSRPASRAAGSHTGD